MLKTNMSPSKHMLVCVENLVSKFSPQLQINLSLASLGTCLVASYIVHGGATFRVTLALYNGKSHKILWTF